MPFDIVREKQVYDAAFQGSHGAFSEDAAMLMLGSDSTMLPCDRFEDVFEAIRSGTARYGVIPVENSLAGSVQRSVDLMFEHEVTIVRETISQIDHGLIGMPGARLKDLRKALSHPVALAQCEKFFRQNPLIEPVSVYDTAGAIQIVIRNGDPTCAAIASRRAAKMWGGELLLDSVQDQPENYTRFLMISKPAEMVRPQGRNYKQTILFRLRNKPGELYRALEPFANHGVDVAKIESRPVKGSPFEYMFYLDLLGRANDDGMLAAVNELRGRVLSLRVLGMYPRA